MAFFTSGTVDTSVVDRSKLPVGVYLVSLTDHADYIGAPSGDRTQTSFAVEDGCVAKGTRGSHIVMHKADKAWKEAKARGEIAAMVGAFQGFSREASGHKVNGDNYAKLVRTVVQNSETGKVMSVSMEAESLPDIGKTAFLVVKPYFNKKTGQRLHHPKTGKPSVTYELYPMSAKLTVTHELTDIDDSTGDDAPAAPEDDAPAAVATDALETALSDGWRRNGETPWYYKKNAPKQLKEPELRAMYGG